MAWCVSQTEVQGVKHVVIREEGTEHTIATLPVRGERELDAVLERAQHIIEGKEFYFCLLEVSKTVELMTRETGVFPKFILPLSDLLTLIARYQKAHKKK